MVVAAESFDLHFLGLKDASAGGRTRFMSAMERLTGEPAQGFKDAMRPTTDPLFRSLSEAPTRTVLDALQDAGVMIEIRPSSAPPDALLERSLSSQRCPSCGFIQPPEGVEDCPRCGLVFAKWEREKIQKMQRESQLEEALERALQIRKEWVEKANGYLESHPLDADSSIAFGDDLVSQEVPFLRLYSDEGPILMTSQRMLAKFERAVYSIPYEMITDVDVGGGLMKKKNRVRLQFTFNCEMPFPSGPAKSMTWSLDKESAFKKDVIMDWAFARRFICGSCGAYDLQFRLAETAVRARCMHCANDHSVDLAEAVLVPDE